MAEASPNPPSHWHKEGRTKTCIMCNEARGLGDFYAYEYTTKQGKRSTRYESRCRDCAVQRRRDQYAANPRACQQSTAAWREKNKEHLIDYGRTRREDPEHKALKARHQRLRKARLRSGQGDNEAIRAIYAEATRIERLVAKCPIFALPELGHKMHVDHIVPLSKGGAHHEDNLQILPIGINMRKGVKIWPTK